jgi:outer membrane lipoprotein SlyB
MSDNENTNFVWSVFDSEDTAVEAGKSLKKWDKADKEIKLGAIGVLHMSDKGKLKVKKMGPRTMGKGALWGAVAGALVAIFAPAALIGGAVAGGLAGGFLGAFHKEGLGLSDEQKDKIKANLDEGKGLLIVLVDDDELEPTKAELVKLGGETESSQADVEAIEAADEEMAEAGVQAEVETVTE